MKQAKTLLLLIFLSTKASLFAQTTISPIQKSVLSIGDQVEIYSEILKENRSLNIYLPQSYLADSANNYPVIYLLDGGMDEDFLHITGLVQFGSFSWIEMLPESIVVGIGNVDRQRDFTFPTSNALDKVDIPTSGKSSRFIEFLSEELQPFIESTYSSNSSRTIIGQSLGGLLATQILFEKPELFDNYIIVSPSLWWDDESLLSANIKHSTTPKSIYIAVGKEGEVMERTAEELHTKLQEVPGSQFSLYFNFLEKQDHGDALHLAVYDAFEKMFLNK